MARNLIGRFKLQNQGRNHENRKNCGSTSSMFCKSTGNLLSCQWQEVWRFSVSKCACFCLFHRSEKCVCVCVCAYVRACVCACVRGSERYRVRHWDNEWCNWESDKWLIKREIIFSILGLFQAFVSDQAWKPKMWECAEHTLSDFVYGTKLGIVSVRSVNLS